MAHGPAPIDTGGAAAPESFHTGKVVGLATTAAIGGFLFGFDSAVINGANAAIQQTFDLSSGMMGFVVSIALLGSAVGAWFAGTLADKYGRRRVMLIAAALFAVSGVGTAFPPSVEVLMFWRLVGGAGIGIASVIAPMYIAEIAPAQLRGRLGSLQQLAIVLGIFATGLTNYLILQAAGDDTAPWLFGIEAWQWMFLVEVVPAIVYFLLALRIPESPRYLVSVGRGPEALKVLVGIFEGDQTAKLQTIEDSLEGDHRPRMSDLRGSSLGLAPIVWVGILLSVFQQFVGINAVFYYSNLIWESVGFTKDQAFQTSMITNFINVVTTLVAIALVDRVGRKPLLLVGSAGMVVTLAILTYVFGTAPVGPDGTPVLPNGMDVVAMLAFNVYVIFFGMSWGPVVWVLLGEMFPNRLRAAALAVAAAAQWVANFIVSTSFPVIAGVSLGLAYGIFTAFAIASFFFVKVQVHETKGKQLEQMTSA